MAESAESKNKDRRVAKDQVKRLGVIRNDIKELEKMDVIEASDIQKLMQSTDSVKGADAKMMRVAIQDAQINCDVSKLGLKSIKQRNAGQQQFKAKEFVAKLKAMYVNNAAEDEDEDAGGVRIHWDKVRMDAAKFFDATPSCRFLAQDMSKQVAKKAKKVRQVNSQRRAGEETQPIYGADEGNAVKKNSEKRKRQMMSQLNSDKEIVMPDLVINPHSFGETVENLFACGVMVSEGYAQIKLMKGQEGKPQHLVIAAAVPPEDSEKVEDKRAIIKLDFAMFERMVKERNIKEAHFKFNEQAEDATIDLDDEDEQSAAQTQQGGGASSKKRRS
mmetsp:Transcript_18320/g.35723  ORF Transcript_18320/g.35723 Transcript_18320/m.35723 type:complete len:331 (+) Transcript_18320:95-1087(+)|eukprot:CAMPEP_0173392964 /NCGR_PEP_ID=MMETSP1356-20130122/21833_1 /TAXON_ID=77927 ORGANISM="Hemiselmis virescens, Strain PCC157" /NCGR_SAMPLE_ID=MMETSP1356 /ASSEMBLY_ACC=CAM_ASM_000847 /LENGTH=330 /DNA_ID=CAMNT_0014350907 /DNA_START=91 /DNA_END=1083 /DNA_ORIENTATION=+